MEIELQCIMVHQCNTFLPWSTRGLVILYLSFKRRKKGYVQLMVVCAISSALWVLFGWNIPEANLA